MADTDLDRFRAVRSEHERALAEIRAGRKRSHWMWYVFPQIAGLGHSNMARRYAITSVDEATAFLEDPELGSDYVEMVEAVWHQVVDHDVRLHDLFGSPDDSKLVSSLTLFGGVARMPDPSMLQLAEQTDEILAVAHSQDLKPCRATRKFLGADLDGDD